MCEKRNIWYCDYRIDRYLRLSHHPAMDNAAARVIDKCGGPERVAEMLGVHVSRVYRWTYPKERGGTGGTIPTRHQNDLLTKARDNGCTLQPSDFFEESGAISQ